MIPKTAKLAPMLAKTFLFNKGLERYAEYALGSDQSEYVSFETGEVIYSVEQYRHAVAFLTQGDAVAYSPQSTQEHPVILNRFMAGSMFGMAAVFQSGDRYVTQVVAQKACRVLFLSQTLLGELFRQDVALAERYIAYLSGRVEYLNRKIAAFTAGEAECQVALYLSEAYRARGEPAFTLPCSISELGKILSLGRASVYRAFERLEERGAIMREGRRFTVRDSELLFSACRKAVGREEEKG